MPATLILNPAQAPPIGPRERDGRPGRWLARRQLSSGPLSRRGLSARDRGEIGLASLLEQPEALLSGCADVGRVGLFGAE
jgi:hypothetical protein